MVITCIITWRLCQDCHKDWSNVSCATRQPIYRICKYAKLWVRFILQETYDTQHDLKSFCYVTKNCNQLLQSGTWKFSHICGSYKIDDIRWSISFDGFFSRCWVFVVWSSNIFNRFACLVVTDVLTATSLSIWWFMEVVSHICKHERNGYCVGCQIFVRWFRRKIKLIFYFILKLLVFTLHFLLQKIILYWYFSFLTYYLINLLMEYSNFIINRRDRIFRTQGQATEMFWLQRPVWVWL